MSREPFLSYSRTGIDARDEKSFDASLLQPPKPREHPVELTGKNDRVCWEAFGRYARSDLRAKSTPAAARSPTVIMQSTSTRRNTPHTFAQCWLLMGRMAQSRACGYLVDPLTLLKRELCILPYGLTKYRLSRVRNARIKRFSMK